MPQHEALLQDSPAVEPLRARLHRHHERYTAVDDDEIRAAMMAAIRGIAT